MIALFILLTLNAASDDFPATGQIFEIPGPRQIQGNISKTNDVFLISIKMKPTTCLDETRNLKINALNLKAYSLLVFNKHVNIDSNFEISEANFKIKSVDKQFVNGELLLKTNKEIIKSKKVNSPQIIKQNNILKIANFRSGDIWNQTLDFYTTETLNDISLINSKINQLNKDQFDTLIADAEKMWTNTFQKIRNELKSDLFLFENEIIEKNSLPKLISKANKSEKDFYENLEKLVKKRIEFEQKNEATK